MHGIRHRADHVASKLASHAACPSCQAEARAAAADLAGRNADVTRLRGELATAASEAGALKAELARLGQEAAAVERKLAVEVLPACSVLDCGNGQRCGCGVSVE